MSDWRSLLHCVEDESDDSDSMLRQHPSSSRGRNVNSADNNNDGNENNHWLSVCGFPVMVACFWNFWSWLNTTVHTTGGTTNMSNSSFTMSSFNKKNTNNCSVSQHPLRNRLRSIGSQSQHRTPTIKRSETAPVTMQGWLYKQGSEGLMLWKRRWFVLSEYCLYYYKAPDEQKILGSLMLPSYKISPCTDAEGKLFRKKFSFKAEHTNMRTYYFAADSRELMVQWMNALSLASILQENNGFGTGDGKKVNSSANRLQSCSNGGGGSAAGSSNGNKFENVKFALMEKVNNSGSPDINDIMTRTGSPASNGTSWHMNNFEELSACAKNGPSHHQMMQQQQPLYANAPPKPRRLTESSEQSPDRTCDDGIRQLKEYTIGSDRIYPSQYAKENDPPSPIDRGGNVSTSQPQSSASTIFYNEDNNVSRRTPETYGRSVTVNGRPRTNQSSEYEELCNLTAVSSTGYANNRERYLPRADNVQVPYVNSSGGLLSPASASSRRPHSADFLEYYDTSRTAVALNNDLQPAYAGGYSADVRRDELVESRRPKSSMDILNSSDSFHWSEESYAQKMRQTAPYFAAGTARNANDPKPWNNNIGHTDYASPSAAATIRINKNPLADYDRRWSNYSSPTDTNGVGEFVRSVSARIPRERQIRYDSAMTPNDGTIGADNANNDLDERLIHRPRNQRGSLRQLDGSSSSQQREESMKRLLEWKQRMLQSPLTRKSNNASSNYSLAQSLLCKSSKENFSQGTGSSNIVTSSSGWSEQNRSDGSWDLSRPNDEKPYKNDDFRGHHRSRSTDFGSENRPAASGHRHEHRKHHRSRSRDESCWDNRRHHRRHDHKRHRSKSKDDHHHHHRHHSSSSAGHEYSGQEVKHRRHSKSRPKDGASSNRRHHHREKYTDEYYASGNNYATAARLYSRNMSSEEDYITSETKKKSRSALSVCSSMSSCSTGCSESVSESSDYDESFATDYRRATTPSGEQQPSKATDSQCKSVEATSGGSTSLDNEEMLTLSSKHSDSGYDTFKPNDVSDDHKRCSSVKSVLCGQKPDLVSSAADSKKTDDARNDRVVAPLPSIVQNRIKEFEKPPPAPEKNSVCHTGKVHFREPLKVSASHYQLNEAQISHLKSSVAEELLSSGADGKHERQQQPYCDRSSVDRDGEVWHSAGYDDSDKPEQRLKEGNGCNSARSQVVYEDAGYSSFTVRKADNDDRLAEDAIYEEHYMPMKPSSSSKANVTPQPSTGGNLFSHSRSNSASSASQVLILETILSEDAENSYIDMVVKSVEDGKATLGDNGNRSSSHYEYLYKASSTPTEPVYTEVGNKKAPLNTRSPIPVRSSILHSTLPDILNSSSTSTLPMNKSNNSSDDDADDEASKDFDSSLASNRQRFSLSDTFRPASYYLGCAAEQKQSLQQQDSSSDSDLVSPPPIPTSPPPIEEFVLQNDKEEESISLLKEEADSVANSTEIIPNDGQDSALEYRAQRPETELHSYYNLSNLTNNQLPNVRSQIDNNTVNNNNSNSNISNISSNNNDDNNDNNINNNGEPGMQMCAETAPYYYGDLLKLESALSNVLKKNDNRTENTDGKLTNVLVNDDGSSFSAKLIADVRNTARLISLMDKNTLEDEKNLYSSEVFHKINKLSYRSETPEPLSDSKNLYSRSVNKNSIAPNNSTIAARRTRSLEGLLDVADTGLTAVSKTTTVPSSGTCPNDVANGTGLRSVGSDYTRRSERTAAKTNNEHQNPVDIVMTTNAPVVTKRISREVTYVNDCISAAQIRKSKQTAKEYTEDYRDVRKIRRQIRSSGNEIDDGVHYERLNPRATNGGTVPQAFYYADESSGRREQDLPQKTESPIKKYHPRTGSQSFLEEGMYPIRPPSATTTTTFEIDREKLRQWDLMSSAPVAMISAVQKSHQLPNLPVKPPTTSENSKITTQTSLIAINSSANPQSSPVSGSGSVIGRDPLPPRQPAVVSPPQLPPQQHQFAVEKSTDPSVLNSRLINATDISNNDAALSPPPSRLTVTDFYNKKADSWWNDVNVSAGELLGRTHEELVLLLIQLRRQSASLCKAIETCHTEIENQGKLSELNSNNRTEHMRNLDETKKRLMELERQYEKGKPLVNLVDNMVKLGSLFRSTSAIPQNIPCSTPTELRDKLEFNQGSPEQRFLTYERRADGQHISPDRTQLQAKMEELYRLDKLLQQESSTLQCLKQDKEMLENALGGLKYKLQGIQENPSELERYRKQQHLLERELSHVRSVLARNSKKLEETAASNSRLEAELLSLRQNLQWNQRNVDSGFSCTPSISALESELKKAQMLVSDLQRQRYELSHQVKQLSEKSQLISQKIRPGATGLAGTDFINAKRRPSNGWFETDLDNEIIPHDTTVDYCMSPTVHYNVPGSVHLASLGISNDHSKRIDHLSNYNIIDCDNDDNIPPPAPESQYCRPLDMSEADERMKRYYGIIPREKSQEIKTVRIVKRESERRQRDRDRSGNIGIPLAGPGPKRMSVLEEINMSQIIPQHHNNALNKVLEERIEDENFKTDLLMDSSTLPMSALPTKTSLPLAYSPYNSQANVNSLCSSKPLIEPLPLADELLDKSAIMVNSAVSKSKAQDINEVNFCKLPTSTEPLYHHRSNSSSGRTVSNSIPRQYMTSSYMTENKNSTALALPSAYESEAAKEIIQELVENKQPSTSSSGNSSNSLRRLVPREKRRHHTVSSGKPLIASSESYNGSARARDDVDMERALRPRLQGTPDVVRSTLSRSDNVKYSADTIDNILGTPNKIRIPERYVPENIPQLSPEEQDKRLKKAEAIRKMLSESSSLSAGADGENENEDISVKKKLAEEREHLLHLNQILAQQVMEKSKMVAGANSSSNMHQ